MYDYDELDFLDTIEVMVKAMSIKRRLEEEVEQRKEKSNNRAS